MCVPCVLREQAERLEAACSALCSSVPAALSPTAGCVMRLAVSPGGGCTAALGAPQVGQQQPGDGAATLVMHAHSDDASSSGGKHCLVVLHCYPPDHAAGRSSGGGGPCMARATCVVLPPGVRPVQPVLYHYR